MAFLGNGEIVAVQGLLPANEFGFSLCQAQDGKLVKGPTATGTPINVSIPVTCPAGSHFTGLFHSHPRGVAYPSPQDIDSALRVGAKILCIQSDQEMKCFRIQGS